jgi:hypothetical protein
VAITAVANPQLPTARPWRWLMAPALAALYPVLSVYADYVREANERDVVICGIVVVAAAILVGYLFRFVYPSAPRASLAAVVFVIWSFAFSGYIRIGRRATEPVCSTAYCDYILYVVWILLIFLALFLLWRFRCSDRRMEQLYTFVLLACIASIGLAAVQGVRGYLHANHADDAQVSIWESDQPTLPAAWKPQPMAEHRDVYYLLLDRYGSEKSLQQFFAFDNSEFCNQLEKRGFVVDRKAITSYPMTSTSMASTLNMRWLNSQVATTSDYFAFVDANEVGKSFIKAGYKYHFFGNQYDGLRMSSIAQWNLKISVMPSEFADSLVSMTPFRPLIGRRHKHEFTLEKFAAVAELAKDSTLTFTYAHFLVPHPPYAFARDGSAQSEINRATQPEQELYIDQLVATNRLILKTIDDILSSSAVKPIIILQADEGPYLMAGDESLSRDEQMAKRLGILNAILIPDEAVRQRLPKPLMPINTFRFLFKEYFGAPIELLPDRVFFWETPEPTGAAAAGSRIIEVTRDASQTK